MMAPLPRVGFTTTPRAAVVCGMDRKQCPPLHTQGVVFFLCVGTSVVLGFSLQFHLSSSGDWCSSIANLSSVQQGPKHLFLPT